MAVVSEFLPLRHLGSDVSGVQVLGTLRDLLQMMAGVSTVKAPPLLGGKRAYDGMIQQPDPGAEPSFGIGKGRVHSNQSVIELPQRLDPGTLFRCCLFRRYSSLGEKSESSHVESADAVAQRRLASQRLADLHGL